MSSLIHGFEYDIFISYRQNDNLPMYDFGRHVWSGWVTEFLITSRKAFKSNYTFNV